MSQPNPRTDFVTVLDHHNQTLPVDLTTCTYFGRAVAPSYVEQDPSRLGSDWIVQHLAAGRNLELWRTGNGTWLVIDSVDPKGVVVNLDQLRDLRPTPVDSKSSETLAVAVEARNFRALWRSDWRPSGVCILVGPNGAGKTTLLLLLEFLRSAYFRGTSSAIDYIGGVYSLRSWQAMEREPVTVALTVGDLRWELQLNARGPTLADRPGERVTRGNEIILARAPSSDTFKYHGHEAPLADGDERLGLRIVADLDPSNELAPLIRMVTSTRVYRSYNILAIQQNGSRQSGEMYLHPTGQNAFTVLRNWRDRREARARYEFVITNLRLAFPEVFGDLDFHVAGLTVTVDLFDPKWNRPFPLVLAPDGWITALLHLMAVAGAADGTLIAIDDFGNDLHPYAIRALTKAFREWATDHDLIICVASHSPVAIDEFKEEPSSVFVMEHGREYRPVPLTELYDPEWLGRFSLGRLYASGEFGGQRPRVSVVSEEHGQTD
jgi:predicted ATPase